MNTNLEIACTSKGVGWENRMFVCRSDLEKLFEGEWENRDFVACLKKATPKSRRPQRDALKIKIPHNFVGKGLRVEQPDGKFADSMLTAEADTYIFNNELETKEWWVWIEYRDVE